MSVGHVARLFEAAGIATVIIAIKAFQERLAAMTPPRVVITPHLLGRPLSMSGDNERQRKVILAALELLKNAEQAGTFVKFQVR